LVNGQASSPGKRCLIKGNVISYKTKENIEARVVFQKEPDAALTVVSLSGPKGYKANLFERGHYMAIVSAEGYVSEQLEFNLLHDSLGTKEEVIYNFELVPIRINELIPFYKILFDISSSVISPGSAPELRRLKSMLEENPSIIIRLEGHTDNAGNSRKSIRLAKRRIEAIKKWLTDGGIASGRIKLKAIGGGKSATEKAEKDTRRANRRVEIRVIQL
jgi:outer membrane protein OmpA-like peptidoglycan-associated protein